MTEPERVLRSKTIRHFQRINKAISEGKTVSLTGMGEDEIMALITGPRRPARRTALYSASQGMATLELIRTIQFVARIQVGIADAMEGNSIDTSDMIDEEFMEMMVTMNQPVPSDVQHIYDSRPGRHHLRQPGLVVLRQHQIG